MLILVLVLEDSYIFQALVLLLVLVGHALVLTLVLVV